MTTEPPTRRPRRAHEPTPAQALREAVTPYIALPRRRRLVAEQDVLVDLLSKPIAEANALCIPTPRSPSLENTMADAERWAASIAVPCYAIDDQTAMQVVDGTVEVVSEGHWKLFAP